MLTVKEYVSLVGLQPDERQVRLFSLETGKELYVVRGSVGLQNLDVSGPFFLRIVLTDRSDL